MKIRKSKEIQKYMNNVYDKEKYNNEEWVYLKDMLDIGIEIECQSDGSNNPEMLVDGIFIPYSAFKESETKWE